MTKEKIVIKDLTPKAGQPSEGWFKAIYNKTYDRLINIVGSNAVVFSSDGTRMQIYTAKQVKGLYTNWVLIKEITIEAN